MNFYKHHLGDFDSHTSHLNWLEYTAYIRLLHVYYRTECPLPLDLGECCRLVRATNPAQRQAVENVLSEFFQCIDGEMHNKRCDAEIAEYREKSNKAAASANARWGSERNANGYANAMRTQCDGNANHEPRTKNHKPRNSKTGSVGSKTLPEEQPVNALLGINPGGNGKPTKAGYWAAELMKQNVKTTSMHPTMLQLIEDGYELPAVLEALSVARQRKPFPEFIAIGYLDTIVRNPPKPSVKSWWSSESETLKKGKELGLDPRPGEEMDQYRDRLRHAGA